MRTRYISLNAVAVPAPCVASSLHSRATFGTFELLSRLRNLSRDGARVKGLPRHARIEQYRGRKRFVRFASGNESAVDATFR